MNFITLGMTQIHNGYSCHQRCDKNSIVQLYVHALPITHGRVKTSTDTPICTWTLSAKVAADQFCEFSCLSIFLGSAGPQTPKDIPGPSHGCVFCEKFLSVHVVRYNLFLQVQITNFCTVWCELIGPTTTIFFQLAPVHSFLCYIYDTN